MLSVPAGETSKGCGIPESKETGGKPTEATDELWQRVPLARKNVASKLLVLCPLRKAV